MSACRTTEANYRTAYQQATAGRRDSSNIDNTIYDSFRRKAIKQARIVNGDTLEVKRERVKIQDPTQGQSNTLLQSYVVVAQFKQLFNARSMRDRLKTAGYPDATLLVNGEPLYYVTLGGGDTQASVELLDKFTSNQAITAKAPYPLILEPIK
ncbi:MAG: SPOR domain-containing protein [Clostridiales bacterium]|nr:SPOR domain-containing protein [Clostridiales bacterium]